jgi:hypothetical protein
MTSTESIHNEPEMLSSPVETPSEREQVEPNSETATEAESNSGAIFQAIGVIVGEVNFHEDGKSTVTIGQNEYHLYYIPKKQRVFTALKKEIEATGNHTQRLVVYPKVTHLPRKEQPHQVAFQLVGFDKGREEEGVSEELSDNEFKFSGLWQFIPVCPTPCISVFRNFTNERLEYIKQAELAKKVKFMKASHLPILWKDSLVKPFRFNPKAESDQGRPAFVSLKAKFLPTRNVFGFVALLALPQETAPKFLKASKKDKATVLQTSKKGKPPTKLVPSNTDKDKPQSNHQKPILKKVDAV